MSPLASHFPLLFQGSARDVNLLIEHDTPNRRLPFYQCYERHVQNWETREEGEGNE